jgi:branched-chain amino acid aminotransferase
VAEIHFRGKDLEMPMALGKSGEYAAALKSWLKDIMYGRVQHEWGVEIDEEHWEKYKTNLD